VGGEFEPVCALIPAGEFRMGCEAGRDDEKPVRTVWVGAFELAVLQVRNRDYRVFLQDKGYEVPPEWANPSLNHPDQPVVAVSWLDAIAYCDWLGARTRRRYRLPTEAEWERAARGGVQDRLYVWGNEPPAAHPAYRRRWSGRVEGPRPVGEDEPNPYGLLDIGENIHEWCADWYGPNYYQIAPARDPKGPESGTRRASRGGSWRHHIKVSRCAARSSIPPHFRYADYGFRVARDADPSLLVGLKSS